MNTQLQPSVSISKSKVSAIQHLYNNYAAMLLGYIFEVVKNRAVAEQYLIDVFNEVPHQIDEFSKNDINPLCRLQLIARKKLSPFFESLNDCEPHEKQTMFTATGNKFIKLMNDEQQLVFCGIHYQGKTTAKVAAQLNKTEDSVRKILKECFTIIRSGRDYAGLHR